MKVRLHDFYHGAVNKIVICSLENGKGYTNKSYIFEPGVTYSFQDPILQQYFRGEIGEVREHQVSTPELKEELRGYGVEFEVKKCNSCPTAKPQLWFNPFVIEEDD